MLFLVEACEDVEILKVIFYIRLILKYAFVIVPILLILLVTFDFVKNVLAGKEDDMKKNQRIAIKRIIYAVALFFVMPIVDVIFGLPGLNRLEYLNCWNNANEEYINSHLKISLESNGGILLENTLYCKKNSANECVLDNLPSPTKKSSIFKGWSTSTNCSSNDGATSITISDKTTLYACWEKSEKKANYDDNYYILPNVKEIQQYGKSKNFYQSHNDKWSDSCLGFSIVYASAIKENDKTMIDSNLNMSGNSPSKNLYFTDKYYDTEDEYIAAIYEQIDYGHPCIIEVNGSKISAGAPYSRHYVVAVGYNVNASKNKKNILILDVWDDEIEKLYPVNEKGRIIISGHDTTYYKSNPSAYPKEYKLYIIDQRKN